MTEEKTAKVATDAATEVTGSLTVGDGGGRRIVGWIGSASFAVTKVTRGKRAGESLPVVTLRGIAHPDTGIAQATVRASNRTSPGSSVRMTGDEARAFVAAIGGSSDPAKATAAVASWHAKAAADFVGGRVTVITLPAKAGATVAGSAVRAKVDEAAAAAALAAALAG